MVKGGEYHVDVHGVGISVAINRDCFDAHLLRCFDHAARDLAWIIPTHAQHTELVPEGQRLARRSEAL